MGKKSQEDDEQSKEKTPIEKVKLTLRDGDHEWQYRVPKNTPMKGVMDVFCLKRNKHPNSYRFFIDGVRVHPESTAEEMDLEDGDVIDALTEQIGGSFLP
ncbi:hypothetical protein JCM33374_g2054 [Metschnikowia sp. JCM 33374]|nr:hypothetical protein JCM33374_g2054 [Metschnikowia sp. JCM 33374]